jgi:exoribonuclease II
MPVPFSPQPGLGQRRKGGEFEKTLWDKPIRHYADMVNKT